MKRKVRTHFQKKVSFGLAKLSFDPFERKFGTRCHWYSLPLVLVAKEVWSWYQRKLALIAKEKMGTRCRKAGLVAKGTRCQKNVVLVAQKTGWDSLPKESWDSLPQEVWHSFSREKESWTHCQLGLVAKGKSYKRYSCC